MCVCVEGWILSVGYMKSITSGMWPLKTSTSLGKGKRVWLVSQPREWKMSFVILVSAGRWLADVALWFQSPLKRN